MMRALKILAVATAGYAAYELIDGYLRHRKQSGGPAGRGAIPVHKPIHETTATLTRMPIQPTGHVGGAAMTGGGDGVQARNISKTDPTAGTTRVGRGVVRRGS